MSVLVVKLGTGVLTQGTRSLHRAHMLEIVRCCAQARAQGHRIILVTSGAIAAGREHLGHPELPPVMASKQMLAAVGQSRLIQIWEQLFAIYNIQIGQMLLTRADLEDRERFLNARDMLSALLEYGIVPVINENDAVATTEIKVGDNDNLSALAAVLAGADTLLLLTDQEGLYSADPRSNPEAELISVVERIDAAVFALAGDSVSGLGTGGMGTKIQAAQTATRAGIRVVIGPGARPEVIGEVLASRPVGTLFPPAQDRLHHRKHWLFGPPPAGDLHVDEGAAKALVERGGSLLPKGIVRVEGIFPRGAVVRIRDPQGRDLAHGAARYNSEALTLTAGKHSSEIAGIIGYEYGAEAVHRDDLILTGGAS